MSATAPPRPPRSRARPDPEALEALIEEARRRARRRRRRNGAAALVAAAVVGVGVLLAFDRGAAPVTPVGKRATPIGGVSDGRHFGFLKSVDGEGIHFDRAEFLTGAAGERAARDAGALAPGEPLSNDYFIRDDGARTIALPVADTVDVTVAGCATSCREGFAIGYGELNAELVDERRGDTYRGNAAYWVTVSNGKVVALDEQYLP